MLFRIAYKDRQLGDRLYATPADIAPDKNYISFKVFDQIMRGHKDAVPFSVDSDNAAGSADPKMVKKNKIEFTPVKYCNQITIVAKGAEAVQQMKEFQKKMLQEAKTSEGVHKPSEYIARVSGISLSIEAGRKPCGSFIMETYSVSESVETFLDAWTQIFLTHVPLCETFVSGLEMKKKGESSSHYEFLLKGGTK